VLHKREKLTNMSLFLFCRWMIYDDARARFLVASSTIKLKYSEINGMSMFDRKGFNHGFYEDFLL